MENEQLLQLLEKYHSGTCNAEELQELDKWYQQHNAGEGVFLKGDTEASRRQLANDMLAHFRQYTLHKQALVRQISRTKQTIYRAAAAAAILILLAVATYNFYRHKPAAPQNTSVATTDILPGGNKAMLILSNGDRIELEGAATGKLAQQGASDIEKTNDGLLVYNPAASAESANNATLFNTISTPRGGQYQVVLSDGTHVWLNAASTLKYPATFNGNERRVELTGEAYFEVTNLSGEGGKDKMPFIVDIYSPSGDGGRNGNREKENRGAIEVLGTRFNINSYTDEEAIKTTLLEGKVKVTANGADQPVIITPGQQAQIRVIRDNKSSIRVMSDANTEEAVAWKNGLFTYTNADIQTIMRQAARWYDLEVVYEGNITAERFRGKIERTANLSDFLKILELNNIKFKIDGKKVVVNSE